MLGLSTAARQAPVIDSLGPRWRHWKIWTYGLWGSWESLRALKTHDNSCVTFYVPTKILIKGTVLAPGPPIHCHSPEFKEQPILPAVLHPFCAKK